MKSQIDIYKDTLLNAGFEEATMRPYRFWKHLTPKTAFVINLKELENGVGILYGVMSTAPYYDEGSRDFLKRIGASDDDCNLRFYSEIKSPSDEATVKNTVSDLYKEYKDIDKDTLLEHVKERRKQFTSQITDYLKPLGFRKRSNQWNKKINDDMILQICLDKVPYMDVYSFEVFAFLESRKNSYRCYGCQHIEIVQPTVVFDFKDYAYSGPGCAFDLQLLPKEILIDNLHRIYEQYALPFIENSLQYLGEQPFVQAGCHCPRNLCENCWIQKNTWGK